MSQDSPNKKADQKAAKKKVATIRRRRGDEQEESMESLRSELGRLKNRVRELQTELLLDDLTGLFNARCLKDRLEKALDRARSQQSRPVLLFIDVDYFKSINELHGHQTGGDLLNQVGRIIARSIRVDDVAFRYGGDEFVVLVDGGQEGGQAVGERIRSTIEKTDFRVHGLGGEASVHLTVSIGMRVVKPEDTSKSILDEADRAMFEAKRKSRNTLVAA